MCVILDLQVCKVYSKQDKLKSYKNSALTSWNYMVKTIFLDGLYVFQILISVCPLYFT